MRMTILALSSGPSLFLSVRVHVLLLKSGKSPGSGIVAEAQPHVQPLVQYYCQIYENHLGKLRLKAPWSYPLVFQGLVVLLNVKLY